jgi:hypothetical protein
MRGKLERQVELRVVVAGDSQAAALERNLSEVRGLNLDLGVDGDPNRSSDSETLP